MSLTYADYLALDELLELQRPRSEGPEHDEMLFIIIHQVYELWFKQILYEIDYLNRCFWQGDIGRVHHLLKRILTIFKTLVAQVDILETMTPLEFLSFRDRLESASGFQSFQFRELEFVLGLKRTSVLKHYSPDSSAWNRLHQRLESPTVWDAFLRYLSMKGYGIPDDVLKRDVRQPVQPDPRIQAILLDIYRHDPFHTELCERLVDLDEGFQEWRYRHVKMVERTIGNKPGTGGSTGVEYLKSTLFRPVFPDLWIIRTEL